MRNGGSYSLSFLLGILLITGCLHTPHHVLTGKWVSVDDEEEFSGRYVYEFNHDGTIMLLEYRDKQETTTVRRTKIGSFVPVTNGVVITWQNGNVPAQEYRIQEVSSGLLLESVGKSRSLRLIKTEQCR